MPQYGLLDYKDIQMNLYKLGYLTQEDITGESNLNTTNAIKQFQAQHQLVPDGEIGDAFLRAMQEELIAMIAEETPVDDTTEEEEPKEEFSDDTPFFDRDTIFRRNNVDIEVEYGENKTSTRKLTHVHFRSLGQELDGSGNPLYDVIEFIAQDVKEE